MLIRTDLNVPMSGTEVSDATRIERLLPTLRDLTARGAKVIVLSHFGRPKGKPEEKYSLRPVAKKLASMMEGTTVLFGEDCVGPLADVVVAQLQPGQIAVLENLRFHEGEEKNDPDFAGELAKLGDIYVNDAFSVSHRAHASTEALARLLPAYAGPSMMAEINALKLALDRPERPVAAIIGGSKVSTKIDLLVHLVKKMDYLIVGGGMANTFLYAKKIGVGKSLCEPGLVETVDAILSQAAEFGLPDRFASRRRCCKRIQGTCRDPNGAGQRGAGGFDDSRCWPPFGGRVHATSRQCARPCSGTALSAHSKSRLSARAPLSSPVKRRS